MVINFGKLQQNLEKILSKLQRFLEIIFAIPRGHYQSLRCGSNCAMFN